MLVAKKKKKKKNNNNSNPRFVFIFLQTMRSMRDYMVTDIFDGWGILMSSGTAEGEGLVGPRPHHFFAPPPPLFALKGKIIKIKKKT